jgi:hypothetical protein
MGVAGRAVVKAGVVEQSGHRAAGGDNALGQVVEENRSAQIQSAGGAAETRAVTVPSGATDETETGSQVLVGHRPVNFSLSSAPPIWLPLTFRKHRISAPNVLFVLIPVVDAM